MARKFPWTIFLLLLFCVVSISARHSYAENRVALILGNGAYVHTSPLRNPVNDAEKLSEAFQKMGFTVLRGIDQTKSGMDEQIGLFSRKLQGAGLAVFFYAGHGIQINSRNYLVPVDFDPEKGSDLTTQLIRLDDILHELEKGKQNNIIFLDACRDNPMADQLASSLAKGRSMTIDQDRGVKYVSKGLAEVEGKAGTLIAYATQPGNIALDGVGPNSPFTESLLKHIETPGLEIRDMLTKVRASVMGITKEKQIPWDHSSLVKDVYFKKKNRGFAPPP